MNPFAMNQITQTMWYRQSLILYAKKYGVTKAAIRYKTNRQYIYRWMKRYDGTLQSLADRSHRPHSHPNQHTPEEIKLIEDMRRRNPNAGLVVFWVKPGSGYTRSISGLYSFLRKRGQLAVKLPNPKYVPKPYEKMTYSGQRVQIDVKYVPPPAWSVRPEDAAENGAVITNTPLRMNTAVPLSEAFKEHSSYSSASFQHCVKRFPMLLSVQTIMARIYESP